MSHGPAFFFSLPGQRTLDTAQMDGYPKVLVHAQRQVCSAQFGLGFQGLQDKGQDIVGQFVSLTRPLGLRE
jgi:hypothetical protein